MSQDFFDVSQDDLTVNDTLVFMDKEIVKFTCIDISQNAQNGTLRLKCNVLSGAHAGKTTDLYLTSKDNEVSKKVKAQFLKAFWTTEQILARQANPRQLIGRTFSAKSRVSTKEGKTYQNWEQYQDEGTGNVPAQAPNQAASAPLSAAQQTTF